MVRRDVRKQQNIRLPGVSLRGKAIQRGGNEIPSLACLFAVGELVRIPPEVRDRRIDKERKLLRVISHGVHLIQITTTRSLCGRKYKVTGWSPASASFSRKRSLVRA